jgi:hypothetical protein
MVEAGFDGLGSLWYDSDPINPPLVKLSCIISPMKQVTMEKKKNKKT